MQYHAITHQSNAPGTKNRISVDSQDDGVPDFRLESVDGRFVVDGRSIVNDIFVS